MVPSTGPLPSGSWKWHGGALDVLVLPRERCKAALGLAHAPLPTKVQAPGAAHLQAARLLSVDRQEVQSLQDNAWNAALAAQILNRVWEGA